MLVSDCTKSQGSYPGIILVRLINTSFTFPPYPDTYVIFFQVIMRLYICFVFFTTYATHVLLTKIVYLHVWVYSSPTIYLLNYSNLILLLFSAL